MGKLVNKKRTNRGQNYPMLTSEEEHALAGRMETYTKIGIERAHRSDKGGKPLVPGVG
jgi:hypothetical protein